MSAPTYQRGEAPEIRENMKRLRTLEDIILELEKISEGIEHNKDIKKLDLEIRICKHAIQVHAIQLAKTKLINEYPQTLQALQNAFAIEKQGSI